MDRSQFLLKLHCIQPTHIVGRSNRKKNMARSKTNKRHKRALSTLLEKGVIATGMGIAFLIAPIFLGTSPVLKLVAAG